MNRPLLVLALACLAAAPAAAQNPPASSRPPSTHGVDANRAAENAILIDAAQDARRRSAVDRTTDEADEPLRPDRVGQVRIDEIQAAPEAGGRDDPAPETDPDTP